MSPNLLDALRGIGIGPVFAPLSFAAVLTVAVFLAQSLASWFGDRNR